MNKDLLRTGDKGHIKFRFMYRPEYLKVGTTILFREGRTKGLGVVSSIVIPTGKEKPLPGIKA
jgi:GTPase